ncbi:Chromatin assembly factor 1 subunit rlf2 [Golovinomyces cichoracearum]|uniref:Chromatin assembly factor 1 subunit rlf2 n=1 Tax=Golovinomyces cichoracearum TaxID=62708 RepID=A0A420J8P0_9PEZI|nr:Chromatin assembly factor 1 subunit rlf2 [Golovinomyces cichoracearum]
MTFDVPQLTKKRDHNSFSEECTPPTDPVTVRSYFTENNDTNNNTTSTTSDALIISSAPPSFSTLDKTATSQPSSKKIKFVEDDSKKNQKPKDLSKAELKARKEKQKEEERERRDIERKKRELEREEKRLALEIEKQAREEKRRKIEEEKKRKKEQLQRKERSQMKLGCFFAASASVNTPQTGSADTKTNSPENVPRINNDVEEDQTATTAPAQSLTPYLKLFPAFFIQNGVTLAPFNWFKRHSDELKQAQENIDMCITGFPILEKPSKVCDILNLPAQNRVPRGRKCESVREIMNDVYSRSSNRTNDLSPTYLSERLLKPIPLKSLKFYEDVRPPYIGTFTYLPTHGTAKVARNPFRKHFPNTNYEYDSEAEWIEDEDGEDLKSDEEEEEFDDDEDIDGFLDDENDEIPYSRQVDLNGDLVPISTGICWEDDNMHNSNDELSTYKLEFLLDPNMTSINPFLTSYWTPVVSPEAESKTVIVHNTKKLKMNNLNHLESKTSMSVLPKASSGPVPISQTCQITTSKSKETIITAGSYNQSTSAKLIAPADMEDFKTAVAGSDLSKIGLIEVLKKRFPGRSAATIKATLEVIARRGQKGQKEAEKRWILL